VKSFLFRWVVLTIALKVADLLMSGITCTSLQGLLLASLLLTALNTFVKPLLLILAAPLLILSLGIFYFVLNAILLYFTGTVMQSIGFEVHGFWSALGGSLVVSFVSTVLGFFGKDKPRVMVQGRSSPPQPQNRDNPPPGKGPIIDI